MKRILPIVSIGLLFACSTTHSSVGDAANAKAEFEWMSTLTGEWTGTAESGDKKFPVDTTFRLTGNNSAIEEKIFPGTEHEMVSMYHLDGGQLMHTHYCALGNQPRMIARPSETKGSIQFDFHDATNLASMKADHMHDMRLQIVDPNHLEMWWTAWKDGKADHAAHFVLARK